LKKYFKTYGNVQDAVVMKDPVSKRSRGFGFITFYEASAVDAVLANDPHTLDGRKVSTLVFDCVWFFLSVFSLLI
jgi:RNA-binding protein Musashi